jgi:hypothetical protein
MNRRMSFCLMGVVGLIGCSEPNAPVANSDAAVATQGSPADNNEAVTFVSLKVPNMT